MSPQLAVALSRRFPGATTITAELQRLVAQDAGEPAVQVRGPRGRSVRVAAVRHCAHVCCRSAAGHHHPAPCPQNLAEAAPLLATPAAAKANAPQLQHLAVWAPLPLLDAIALAAGAAGHHPAVLAYVMRSLQACRPEEVAFFLPQLIQVGGCAETCAGQWALEGHEVRHDAT